MNKNYNYIGGKIIVSSMENGKFMQKEVLNDEKIEVILPVLRFYKGMEEKINNTIDVEVLKAMEDTIQSIFKISSVEKSRELVKTR